MGLFDSIRDALGGGAERAATRGADPEDLFGLSTAYVTMHAELDFDALPEAGLCFGTVESTDFRDALRDVADVLEEGEAETGTESAIGTDDHGYGWVVLRDSDFEDLVTSAHFAADTLIERGYGNRLLAAAFGFERGASGASASETRTGSETTRERAVDVERAYWIYSFRRGTFYPFAPRESRERDQSLEFKLETVLDGELDVEGEKEYWSPLWPDSPGGHPWGSIAP
jgi:hypothetical protein